jgi:hypothetical protein
MFWSIPGNRFWHQYQISLISKAGRESKIGYSRDISFRIVLGYEHIMGLYISVDDIYIQISHSML